MAPRPRPAESVITPCPKNRVNITSCYGLEASPHEAEFYAYARSGTRWNPFSVGLGVRRLDGSDQLRIVRMNGPHLNPHTNPFPERHTLPVGSHVHYLTERGIQEQRNQPAKKQKGDQYALLTVAYGDIRGALRLLARRTNIQRQTLTLDLWAPDQLTERRAG